LFLFSLQKKKEEETQTGNPFLLDAFWTSGVKQTT
jgi:hypothetical protein